MRDIYLFVIEYNERVRQVGLKRHLKEKEARAVARMDLMGHLERRYCRSYHCRMTKSSSHSSNRISVEQ
jgi:hypothetical protein